MAKTAAKEVVTTTGGGVPANFDDLKKQYAGAGVSTRAEDNLVPLIYLLQSNSPQVEERSEAHIAGAKAGHIWLRNAPDPIVDGNEGIIFQPCYFHREVTEWVPRDEGGGFIARHDFTDETETMDEFARRLGLAQERDEDRGGRIVYMKDGHEFIEARVFSGHVWRNGQSEPYQISLTSTGHTVGRGWNTSIMRLRDKDGLRPPIWGTLWRLPTRLREKGGNKWFVFDPRAEGTGIIEYEYGKGKTFATEADAKMAWVAGQKLNEDFTSGAKRGEVPVAREGEGADNVAEAAGL